MAVSPAKIAITFSVVFTFCLCSLEASDGGFSIELIHRDSPRSPLYNPAETPTQRLRKSLARNIARANSLRQAAAATGSAPFSTVTSNGGEYLMNISIGTPPFQILGTADTGSDLIWTQCEPCTNCFQQVDPLFDPQKSSTYRDVSCTSSTCSSLGSTSCGGNTCQYFRSYGDKSYTRGDVAVETVTLSSTSGRPIAFPRTIIGCGHDNGGTFNDKTSGIIGLGGSSISLISQMGQATGSKFAYCLVPLTAEAKGEKSSQLSFGSRAEVTGSGTVSTPLVPKSPDTFYFLTLEAISVGSSRIEFGGSAGSASEGNIIIDSGTTVTRLPEDFYSQIESALTNQIELQPVDNPPVPDLPLCYRTTTDDINAPVLIAHFTGADVMLGPLNTFIRLDENNLCFAFAPTPTSVGVEAIYGNIAQHNFLVGYDIEKKAVSFKPIDCTKF
ncbi:hypothetical protein CDL15_Pgr024494 [Punica granatum]|uniref:Peptidase A1 domain-containing protein n=1 Tax=Punica granatum TaxID=22663 RepID=A0A218XYM9_PUNGR|nr:hypothetical protein CDL15_Pgr024494 [Punica granatum]